MGTQIQDTLNVVQNFYTLHHTLKPNYQPGKKQYTQTNGCRYNLMKILSITPPLTRQNIMDPTKLNSSFTLPGRKSNFARDERSRSFGFCSFHLTNWNPQKLKFSSRVHRELYQVCSTAWFEVSLSLWEKKPLGFPMV